MSVAEHVHKFMKELSDLNPDGVKIICSDKLLFSRQNVDYKKYINIKKCELLIMTFFFNYSLD